MNQPLSDLQKSIGLKFKNLELLNQALVHRSYLNENKSLKLQSNERFEFLGDAILELWTTEHLFTAFPSYTEGVLTNLRSLIVCTQNLALVANDIKLGDYVLLSRGEEAHQGRSNQSILADTLESLIGAIYLDQGIKSVDKFLTKYLIPSIEIVSSQKVFKDPKSQFQEIAQSKKGVTPHYVTVSESGPDHQKSFVVAAYIGEDLIAKGSGNSKQKAEEAAAIAATNSLNS